MDKTTKTSYVFKGLLTRKYRYIVIYEDDYDFYYARDKNEFFNSRKRYIEFFKPTYDVKYKK